MFDFVISTMQTFPTTKTTTNVCTLKNQVEMAAPVQAERFNMILHDVSCAFLPPTCGSRL